jgi:hypothetical protein
MIQRNDGVQLDHGIARVIGFVELYVVLRYPRCAPFLMTIKEVEQLPILLRHFPVRKPR